jgi:hypothetical protein
MMDFSQVRTRVGGLKGVITKLGDAPPDHKWKSFPQCPFCGKKECAGVFTQNGFEFFKCHHRDCNSGNRTVSEVGYLSLRLGLSENKPAEGGPSPAYRKLLELAGAWEEPSKPEVPKSKPGHDGPSLSRGSVPNAVPPDENRLAGEALLQAAIEVIQKERKASASVLKQRLRLGSDAVQLLLKELEQRGVLGPAQEGRARQILNLPPDPAEESAGAGSAGEPQPGNGKALESPPAPVPEDVGIHGQGSGDPVAVAGPAAQGHACISGPAFIEDAPASASESPQAGASSPPAVPAAAGPGRGSEPDQPGFAALGYYISHLEPTAVENRKFLPDGRRVPDPLPTAIVKELQYRPESLEIKRGIFPETCELLGFKANHRGNEKLFGEMEQLFDWEERLASGLWLEASMEHHLDRRPDRQFFGWGIVGKKPENERRDEDDKWQWGWCEPPVIPYFDELGKLVKARPHKGGARRGTAAGSERIYVPRAYQFCADLPPEKFSRVIITEGEFKAAVIWQSIGQGAALLDGYQTPVGVCALPGISFARNEEYREDLEEWLRAVECKTVTVAFDDEDKSHKPLRQRFDSVIYAQYLAIDLAQKLNIVGKYLKLPEEWRDENGKADWDGAAAMICAQARREWASAQQSTLGGVAP